MTTLAIIGGGIAGRSLIYALAKQEKIFSEILLFDSDAFAHSCSLRSTAIVAPRGVSTGHSDLGDLIFAAFKTFSAHVEKDIPAGVFPITQYTGAITKLEQFQKRYPNGQMLKKVSPLSFKNELYLATESAYLIDPKIYLDWLLKDSQVKLVQDFVTQVSDRSIKTHSGAEFPFDHVVFAGGVYNQFFDFKTKSQSAQGSYLEFSNVDYGTDSFSLTLEGDNLIYHAHSHKLLIGSTTASVGHELPPVHELREIYDRLSAQVDLELPSIHEGRIMVGLREKAPKRTPYQVTEGHQSRVGGFYKNGYSLGLHLGKKLAADLKS